MNWDKAKGSFVKIDGKWKIDFTSSIFTQNFGHSNPYVLKEIRKQLSKCIHAYDYTTEVQTEYLEMLKAFVGYKHVLLFTTGTEATEVAVKVLHHNGYNCRGIQKAMHGRSLAAEALAGKRQAYKIESWEEIIPSAENLAVFIEGYRGYDCKQLSPEDVKTIKHLQKKNIIIFDEIQSGFYRTDNFLVSLKNNIKPDMLLLGKSMGGGLPLSAVCYEKDFSLEGIELSTTHGGQPVQMAAGLGVLKYIRDKFDPDLYERNVQAMNCFFAELNDGHIENNHLGMIGAVGICNEKQLHFNCLKAGVLLMETGKGWLKIAPPVLIDTSVLKKGLEIIKAHLC